MNTFIFKTLIHFCNSRPFNALLRCFANARLSRKLIPWYIRHYQIDLSQVKKELHQFTSLNDFFIRELLPTARPVDPAPDALCSPVDALLAFSQTLTSDARFEIKGQNLSLAELLGSESQAESYSGGHILVLYLSPADYHHIHAPWSGVCLDRRALGRKSWPVNDDGLRYGPRPLCTNFRLIHEFAQGCCIFVGATNVNSIISHELRLWQKGGEVGYFQFGSTVVLLFKKGQIEAERPEGCKVKMGERIGRFIGAAL